jgi:hypothetical protein
MRDDFETAWSKLRPEITARLELITTLEGVLQKASEHAARKWIGPGHSPAPGVVSAFTVARLGNLPQAESILRECLTKNEFLANPGGLFNALRKVQAIGTIHG